MKDKPSQKGQISITDIGILSNGEKSSKNLKASPIIKKEVLTKFISPNLSKASLAPSSASVKQLTVTGTRKHTAVDK